MKKLLTILIAALMSVCALFSFTACGNQKDPDKLYVGMECGYAPFNYTQTTDENGAVKISNAPGYANGYDVLIAKKIAESLGKELVIVKYEWDALIPAVQSGALDFIIAGMSRTDERKESIDFSEPYYTSQLVIVVRKAEEGGKFANAKTLADFNGAKIVAQNGTFHDKALNAQGPAFGITRATPMESFPLMINALKTKAVDGYVAEDPGAQADCAANSEFTYIPLVNNDTGFTTTPGDVEISVGLKKGSEYLTAINDALTKISKEERSSLLETAIRNSFGNSVA